MVTEAHNKYTLRQYLLMRAVGRGANWTAAVAAVNRALRNNPNWRVTEERTFREWEDSRPT